MPHWKSMTDREYLYAFDLDGKDVTLTIDRVVGGEIQNPGKSTKTKKPLCYFKNTKSGKPLALNATNCKTIAALYGSNDVNDWAGKRITLYPTTTSMGGETVECIRIRNRVPPASQQRGAAPSAPAQSEPREPGADEDEPPPGTVLPE